MALVTWQACESQQSSSGFLRSLHFQQGKAVKWEELKAGSPGEGPAGPGQGLGMERDGIWKRRECERPRALISSRGLGNGAELGTGETLKLVSDMGGAEASFQMPLQASLPQVPQLRRRGLCRARILGEGKDFCWCSLRGLIGPMVLQKCHGQK